MKNQNFGDFKLDDETVAQILKSFKPEDFKKTERRRKIKKAVGILILVTLALGFITLHFKTFSDSMFSISFITFLVWWYGE